MWGGRLFRWYASCNGCPLLGSSFPPLFLALHLWFLLSSGALALVEYAKEMPKALLIEPLATASDLERFIWKRLKETVAKVGLWKR